MAMPGAGPVDDGPWRECEECGAVMPNGGDGWDYWDIPLCDECLARDLDIKLDEEEDD